MIGVHAILYTTNPLKIVLLKRNASAPTNPGKWGLPGGTMEPGESELQCITRELFEELNVDYTDLKYLCVVDGVAFYQDEAILEPSTSYLTEESDGIGLFDRYEIDDLLVCEEHREEINIFIKDFYEK